MKSLLASIKSSLTPKMVQMIILVTLLVLFVLSAGAPTMPGGTGG